MWPSATELLCLSDNDLEWFDIHSWLDTDVGRRENTNTIILKEKNSYEELHAGEQTLYIWLVY